MNPAYIRIGGVIMDLPEDGGRRSAQFLEEMPARIDEYETILDDNPIWLERNEGVGVLSAEDCLALGVTGPILRSAGVPNDLRKDEPYCGYETYEFDVPTRTEADAYARYRIRLEEMRESMRIIEQCLDRLQEPGPVMVEDPKVGVAGEAVGGPGRDRERPGVHPPHHGGVDGGADPSLQDGDAGRPGAGGRGLPGRWSRPAASSASTWCPTARPAVPREDPRPLVVNLQATPPMVEGSLVADAIAAIASIDPVMGGVDR